MTEKKVTETRQADKPRGWIVPTGGLVVVEEVWPKIALDNPVLPRTIFTASNRKEGLLTEID